MGSQRSVTGGQLKAADALRHLALPEGAVRLTSPASPRETPDEGDEASSGLSDESREQE